MICTLFIRDGDFGSVGHVDLVLVRLRLCAALGGIAPTLLSSPTRRRLRGLLRLRGLTLSLWRLLRRLCSSSLLHAGVFPVVRVKSTLLIKNGMSFLIIRRAAELGRTRVAKPRVFPRTECTLRYRSTRGLLMSVLVAIETGEVILASLPLRAVRACCTEDHCPRLEEVFCG